MHCTTPAFPTMYPVGSVSLPYGEIPLNYPRTSHRDYDSSLLQTWSGFWAGSPWYIPNGYEPGYSQTSRSVTGANHLIRSSGHDYRHLSARGPDKGGPFEVRKQESSSSSNFPRDTYLNGWTHNWRGMQYAFADGASPNSSVWPIVSPSSDQDMIVLGTQAIARVIPTNPVADLATFIGELREGIPRLGLDTLKRRSGKARSAGSDYLNYEFGWKPLVNDIKKFAKAVTQQEKILRQYERNSGKPLRRNTTISDTTSTEMEDLGSGWKPRPFLPYYVDENVVAGRMTKITVTKCRQWFSGSFTYYLPPMERDQGIWSTRANKLLGTRLTPELVWNLSPWSWALDWFGNTGDVLHNISAFANDGLVMPYAYVMEEKSITHTYELRGVRYNFPNTSPQLAGDFNFDQSFVTTTKKRLGASPYGFGLLPDVDFTPRQWAISVALGLSRGLR